MFYVGYATHIIAELNCFGLNFQKKKDWLIFAECYLKICSIPFAGDKMIICVLVSFRTAYEISPCFSMIFTSNPTGHSFRF